MGSSQMDFGPGEICGDERRAKSPRTSGDPRLETTVTEYHSLPYDCDFYEKAVNIEHISA